MMVDGNDKEIAFVVGAGRSGSTLLYKLLCLHVDVAFINNYDIRLPLALSGWVTRRFNTGPDRKRDAWFSDAGNAYFISRPLQKRFFPTPVEGESVYARSGIPLHPEAGYQPDAQTKSRIRNNFAAVCDRHDAKLFVSKRTANNRRIAALSDVFPGARFVHLIRDGRDVAHSLSKVEWWAEHTVWWDGRTALEMENSGIDRLLIAARNWVRETEEVIAALRHIAPDRVLTVHYEDLMEQPDSTIRTVAGFLGLEESAAYLRVIDSVGLQPRPSGWTSNWSEAQKALVVTEQQALLTELGYGV